MLTFTVTEKTRWRHYIFANTTLNRHCSALMLHLKNNEICHTIFWLQNQNLKSISILPFVISQIFHSIPIFISLNFIYRAKYLSPCCWNSKQWYVCLSTDAIEVTRTFGFDNLLNIGFSGGTQIHTRTSHAFECWWFGQIHLHRCLAPAHAHSSDTIETRAVKQQRCCVLCMRMTFPMLR